MQKETSTLFPYKAIFVFWFIVASWSLQSYAQTTTSIPELCNTGAIIELYDYVNPDGGTFAIIPGATPGLSGHTFDPSAAGIGSYTIRWTHNHVGSGHIDMPVTVVGLPTDPVAITSVPDKFCVDQGGNIELTITGGSGTILHWYDDFPGGNEVGIGSPLTLSAPTISTTYYAVWENACGISLDYNYQVIVYQVSAGDMHINGLSSPYCSDGMNDFVNGEPNWGYLDKVFTFSGPGAGFIDNGNGGGTVIPSNIPDGTYNLTYTVNKDNCTHTITRPVTILPELKVNFTGLISPVCIDAPNQLLIGSHAPGGGFSGNGITDNGNGTAIFDPGAAGGGTHTITYSYTDGNGCSATISQTVEVNNLPSLTFGPLDSHYCVGDPIVHLIGSEAPGGSYTINGNPGPLSYFVDNGDGTADFDPTTAGVGVYTIEYSFVDINNCNNVVSQTTEVHPLPIPSLTGPTNICIGTLGSIYITEAGMSNYDWQLSGGGVVVGGGGFNDHTITINWTGIGLQSVSVNYTDANGCRALSPTVLNVMVHDIPNVTFAPLSNVCLSDAPFNLGGGAPWGGIYSGPGVTAGVFDPAAAGPGTHTITYTYTGVASCVGFATQTITVEDITAQMFNLEPIYCELEADETIITDHIGDASGSFSISPLPTNAALFTDNGNSTATFSPNNCDLADYNVVFTITYTYDNGVCIATAQASTHVYARPSVTFTGLSATYCTNDGIDLLTGTPANGIFTSTGGGLSDNGNGTAQFDPSAAGALGSPYTITYTFSDPGGCFNSEDQIVEVHEAPVPVLISSDADDIICAGEMITFTASGGDTYEFFIDGISIQGPNANDTYSTTTLGNGETVTVEVSNSLNACNALSIGIPTTVIDAPNPTFTSGDAIVCEGDAGLVYETQSGMNNYSWTIIGGVITAGGSSSDHSATVTWTNPGMQSISVNYENSNGCSAGSATVMNVNVDGMPNPNLDLSDANVCDGDVAIITLTASEIGVTYQLRLDTDNSPVGPALNGTGGDLNFSDSPINTTVYNVIASSSFGCINNIIDKSTVFVLPVPESNLLLSDDEICTGNIASIILSNSVPGISYQLRLNSDNSLVGSPAMGNGGDVFFSAAPTSTATYNVLATNGFGCTSVITDISLVIVNPLPPQPVISVSGPTEFCDGESVVLTASSSNGYIWNTGQVNQSILVDTSGVYSVSTMDANACVSPASELVTVTVNPIPVVTLNGLDIFYCLDDSPAILSGDPVPDAMSSGAFSGNGITDNFDGTALFNPATAGISGPHLITYTYIDQNLCTNNDQQYVDVFPVPNIDFIGLDSEYCVDDSPVIITGNEAPFGTFSGTGVIDHGNGTATFDPALAGIGGPYDINYSYTSTEGCSNTFTLQTIVHDVPLVSFSVMNSEYCLDQAPILLIGNHAPAGNFFGTGVFDNGDGTATFDPASAGVGGPYTISYEYEDVNLCSSIATQQTSVFPVPIVSFTGLGSDYCFDHSPVTLVGNHAPDGVFTGPGISDNGNGTAEFNPSIAGVGINIEITYTYSNTYFCQSSYSRFVNVHALPVVSILNLEANYCVNDSDVEIEGNPLPGPLTNASFTGDGIVDHGDGTATFSPSSLMAPNVYPITYTLQDQNLCIGSIIFPVNILELPEPPSTNDVAVCYGEMVPDLVAIGLPGFELIWYNDLGDSIHSGNFFPTGLTEVGIYHFSVTQSHSVNGCESDPQPVTLTIIDLPVVELPPFADLCIDDYIIYLSTGTPVGGDYTGSIGISQLGDGQYVFNPEIAGVGVHNIIYSFTDTTTSCYDTAMQTIIIHDLPVVELLDIEAVYCVWDENDTIYGNHPGQGSFFGPGITDNGDGSAIFSPSIADIGNVHIIYEYTDLITGCVNRDTNQIRIDGAPENVALIQISDPVICVNTIETVTLQAIGGSGTWVKWYELSCGGPQPEILASNADSSMIIIPAPLVSTYYFAQWETECGLSDICADNYIVVNQIPTTPDTAWATPNIICTEDQDTIALFITGGNYATLLEWTQDSCDGLVLGQTNGDPLLIPTPDTTTSYFARWINDCGESACTDAFQVRVIAPAEEVAVAHADSNYFCRYTLDTVELQAFGGRGDTIIWYYDALGLYPVPMDSLIGANQPIGDTIQIIPPTVTTIYYPFRVTPCEQVGGDVSVTLSVFTAPIAPISAATIPNVICFGHQDSVTLVADGGHGVTLEWYSGDCENGVFLGNGNDFNVFPPNNTTTYFARYTTPCGISECVETTLEVYQPTMDPDFIQVDTNQLCAGSLSDIELIVIGGSGDSIIWFADSCGATPLDPSTFYYQSPLRDTIIIAAPLTDTAFYAHWATPCEVSSCVSVDITVFPQPVMIDSVYSSLNNFCSGSIAEITLTALGGEGTEISWTIDSCNGPVIAVTDGAFLTIPSPSDTTTYYAKWRTICDSTECQAVQVNVTPSTQDPVQIHLMESLICDNAVDSITLVLEGGSGYEAVWFYGPYCGNDTIPEAHISYLSAKKDSIRIVRPDQPVTIMANWASYEGLCGSSVCVSLDVFIFEAPTALFDISGGVACENTLLQFSPNCDPGTGLITELSWNFGDGTVVDTNLQMDQFHSYDNFGIYPVELIVTNTYGCQDTSLIPLEISEAPEAAFSYEAACFGQPTLFFDQSISAVDSIASWFWNFNDPVAIDDTSSMQNPSYTFNSTGVFEVILTVIDTGGCMNEIMHEVIVSPGPTAYFSLSNASCQNDPVFFNDSSFVENSRIESWIWNFGDGSSDTIINYPSDPNISHVFTDNGVYTVSLQVVDTIGCSSEFFYQYFEVRPTPIAGFIHTDTACQTGIIHFYDATTHLAGTYGTAWEWSFGDGTIAYDQDPVHSYVQTGEFYQVQMIVTDDYGCQDTAVQEVEVNPSIQIAFQTNTVCQGEATEFIAQLIQPENEVIAEWQWFFGDNTDTIMYTDTINHRYETGGTFYATLIGLDQGGCETIVINQAVNVYPAPVVDYHIPEASCSDPSIFYNHSIANAESIILYHFDYGDGTYETFTPENYPDPVSHNYPAGANEYFATISLTNSNGCIQTTEFLVERESCITTSFLANLPACIGQEIQFINSSVANNESIIIDSIIWQFGDGVIYELPLELGDTVYHAYQAPGPITVIMKLKASNEYGDFTVGSHQTIYVNESPVADFRISESLLCSRDSLHFADQSWVFNGEIVTWKWNFNDHFGENDKSTLRNPAYMYSYGGDYDPHLVVMSDSGCFSTKDRSVSLHSAPVNHLYADVEFGCGPENEIVFRDTSYLAEGNIDYHQWVFGFNDTVYTQSDSLLHQLDIGSYNVISRVVSDVGCVGTDSIGGFNVFDQPLADFGFYPDDPTIKEPEVMFNDKSIGTEVPVEYYHWDFGDGTDTLGLDPFHVFQDTGAFKVVLTIMDQNGCVDTMSNYVYVDAVYSFYMPNAFSPNGNGLNDVYGPVGSYFEDKNYEFYIYSRWGELLFESYDPDVMWEGDYAKTSRNQVPLGVYSWFIRVKDALGSEHVYKGFVTVVR